MNHFRTLDIPNFEEIQKKLVPYILVKYPGLFQFWNQVDQEDLYQQIPELLLAITHLTGQQPLKTYLLVIPNAPDQLVNARLGDASLHADTSVESTRLNWPVLNSSSIETKLFISTGEPNKLVLPTGQTYLTHSRDQCEEIASFIMDKPTVLHVHTIHGLYRAPGPLPRYILSFNFEQPIDHLLM